MISRGFTRNKTNMTRNRMESPSALTRDYVLLGNFDEYLNIFEWQ